MASSVASKGILYLFVGFLDVIGKGRPFAVGLGFILGLSAGAIVMIESVYAGIFTSIGGGFVGALIGAVLFPRAAILLSVYTEGKDVGFGAVVDSVLVHLGQCSHTTVVMERAIYVVSRSQFEGPTLPDQVYEKLANGIHPQLNGRARLSCKT